MGRGEHGLGRGCRGLVAVRCRERIGGPSRDPGRSALDPGTRLSTPRGGPAAMYWGGGPRPTGAGGDVTIVVVGESSAEGVPYRDWLSVGKIVAWQLRRLFPQRMFH